jgi:hypothetical protein
VPRNPLRSPADALRFVIEFAQADIQRAGRRDLDAAELAIRQLLGLTIEHPDRHDFAAKGWGNEPPIPRVELEHLHADARGFLQNIVTRGHTDGVEVTLRFSVARATARRKKRSPEEYTIHYPSVWIVANGSSRDRFRYRLIRLLEDVGLDKLLLCKRKDCKRLFFKMTRKEFCSPRCQSRQYMRNLRAEEREERLRRGGRRRTGDEAKAWTR